MNGKMLVAVAAVLALSGCATVDRTGYSSAAANPAIPADQCNVTVYRSYGEAKANGEIEELCTVYGNSSFSFIHTVAVALDRAKPKACECGATNVYIKSSKPMGWSVAEVELVAFRYKKK